MRKFIAFLIMALVIGNFYVSLKRREPVKIEKKDPASVIKRIDKTIEEDYPQSPTGVIELYNETIDLLYSKKLKDEEVDKVVNIQRKLYETGFANLTPYDEQLEIVNNEVFLNKEKGIKLISSSVLGYSEKDDFVYVEAVHYTNGYDLKRDYILVQELDSNTNELRWKIYGWLDKALEKSESQEE